MLTNNKHSIKVLSHHYLPKPKQLKDSNYLKQKLEKKIKTHKKTEAS